MSSNPADRFKGCAKAEVKAGRTPNPNLGKAAYLIDLVRLKESSKEGNPGFRVEIAMTCLWGIEAGQSAAGEAVGPDAKGTKVSHCLFSGDYFHKSFKEFVLKALDMDPSRELEIADMVCPAANYPEGTSELARIEIMWEKVLPGMICAFDPDTGAATEAGSFDGQVVVEIGTTEKEIEKKINGQPAFDANGKPITNVYRNSYFNRKIGKDEILEKLGEDGIAQFFGTRERFDAIP
jgi:hypothetical protein